MVVLKDEDFKVLGVAYIGTVRQHIAPVCNANEKFQTIVAIAEFFTHIQLAWSGDPIDRRAIA